MRRCFARLPGSRLARSEFQSTTPLGNRRGDAAMHSSPLCASQCWCWQQQPICTRRGAELRLAATSRGTEQNRVLLRGPNRLPNAARFVPIASLSHLGPSRSLSLSPARSRSVGPESVNGSHRTRLLCKGRGRGRVSVIGRERERERCLSASLFALLRRLRLARSE